jgi:hypothetical protein
MTLQYVEKAILFNLITQKKYFVNSFFDHENECEKFIHSLIHFIYKTNTGKKYKGSTKEK